MDLPIRMRIICDLNYRYAMRLKFDNECLTSLTKLMLQMKASICSTIKEMYFGSFWHLLLP